LIWLNSLSGRNRLHFPSTSSNHAAIGVTSAVPANQASTVVPIALKLACIMIRCWSVAVPLELEPPDAGWAMRQKRVRSLVRRVDT
jgi:hypothetical protein